MKIKGKIIVKEPVQNISESFRKREFVLEYSEHPDYPEFIKFELIQDKCDELDAFEIGHEIEVSFNLKGRKWTNPKGEEVYFNSLQAWKIDLVGSEQPREQSQEQTTPNEAGEVDDLPF